MRELSSLENVTAGYDSAIMLDDMSLALEADGNLALLSRNDVDKTTLLTTLMGLTRLHGGRIRWLDADTAKMPPYRRARTGLDWMPQERWMLSSLTVKEHLTAVTRPGA